MIYKFAVLTSMILSGSCMVLHQPQVPNYGLRYNDNANYNFAYQVNGAHTGDIKSQHESRRGDIVLGQYSLVQPNGIQRTVDYRADDHSGFRATVNHQGNHPTGYPTELNANNLATAQHANLAADLENARRVQSYQGWPTAAAAQTVPSSVGHPPVAVSSSSFIQTISHGPIPSIPSPQNQHNNLWA